jgi:prevent-host-death family protein
MPKIISSAELRNKYNEVSEQCHRYGEPTFVTKNGKGDLAIMSIEAYEQMTARYELYSLIQEGLDDVAAGRVIPADRAMEEIRAEIRARRST